MVAEQLVFLDESGVNMMSGERTSGWSKKGTKIPVKRSYQRHDNFSILPAMNINGYLACIVYKGGVDSVSFEDFVVNHVLPKCNKHPGPNSILVMDNAAIHRPNQRV
jgi:DDE superfamily endonuclease